MRRGKKLAAFALACTMAVQGVGGMVLPNSEGSYKVSAAAETTAGAVTTTGAEATTKDSATTGATTQTANATTGTSGSTENAGATTGTAQGTTSASGTTADVASTTTQAGTTTEAATTQAPVTVASPVKELRVSDQTMTSITVSWDAVAGMDGYILETYNYTTKAWDAVDTIVKDDTKTTYSYVVNDLSAGTTHRFRISTYVGAATNVSTSVKSIKTGCVPGIPALNVVKGDKCVRLNWGEVKCTGYNVFMKEGDGEYKNIRSLLSSDTTCRIDNLANGTEYTFKVTAYSTYSATDDGVSYCNTLEGQYSAEEKVTPSSVSKTSTAAALYASNAKFKESSAYKTYALAKKLNLAKNFITPGVTTTNVNGINSANFVTQGSVCAKAYYLLGGYDNTGAENSVIYVMKRSSHKYLMTLVLPNNAKVTDMAFDGTNVWLTAGDKVACIRYSTIKSKVSTGVDSADIAYMQEYTTVANPEYIGYYDGKLWVGAFSTATHYMSGYTIGNKTSKNPTLTYSKRIQMPGKTRAIEIDDDGRMYVVRSYQVKKGLSGYISEVRAYNPSWSSSNSNGTIKKNTATKVSKLPAMASGVTIYNTYTYINFESAKESECKYPTDRTWAVKTSKIR